MSVNQTHCSDSCQCILIHGKRDSESALSVHCPKFSRIAMALFLAVFGSTVRSKILLRVRSGSGPHHSNYELEQYLTENPYIVLDYSREPEFTMSSEEPNRENSFFLLALTLSTDPHISSLCRM